MSEADDPLDASWTALLANWDDDERHKRFVGLARTVERLPDAAKRYRAVQGDAVLGARAKQGVDRVLAVAMQALTPPPREARARAFNLGPPLAAFTVALVFTMLAAQVTGVRALASPLVIVAEAVIAALIPWQRFSGGSAT